MTVDEAINVFSAYPLKDKEEFLAHLMYELTILMRDTYEVGRDGLTNPQRARLINEIQHCISAFLLASLRNDSQHYPDDLLVKAILVHRADSGLEQQLNEAFARLTTHRLTTA
jgi:hypothetical protein